MVELISMSQMMEFRHKEVKQFLLSKKQSFEVRESGSRVYAYNHVIEKEELT